MTLGSPIKNVFMLRDADRAVDTLIMHMPKRDPMTHMSFIVRLENEVKVRLTGDGIATMRVIADAEKKLAAAEWI